MTWQLTEETMDNETKQALIAVERAAREMADAITKLIFTLPFTAKFEESAELAEAVKEATEQKTEKVVVVDGSLMVSSTHLRLMQDRLVGLIDEYEEDLHDSIDALGCKGDCYRCPHPEHPTAEEQVVACLTSVVMAFGIKEPLLTAKASTQDEPG